VQRDHHAFFGVVRTTLVSGGGDYHAGRDNTRAAVYPAMMTQVVRDYSGIPDYRTLTDTEIRFFYDQLRPELRRATKPQK